MSKTPLDMSDEAIGARVNARVARFAAGLSNAELKDEKLAVRVDRHTKTPER
jgi:hypothetical protein